MMAPGRLSEDVLASCWMLVFQVTLFQQTEHLCVSEKFFISPGLSEAWYIGKYFSTEEANTQTSVFLPNTSQTSKNIRAIDFVKRKMTKSLQHLWTQTGNDFINQVVFHIYLNQKILIAWNNLGIAGKKSCWKLC